jgi:predicted ATPase/DNA-binding SARP family transcriptional activator
MAHLSISLLGALRITRDGEPLTDFATDKARALLAYLAVEADRPHRRDALAGLLWPDQPQEKARQSLRQALSDLRKAIGDCDDAPFLLVSRETIQFNADCDHWLDVAAFTDLVKNCETHRHRRTAACLPCLRRMERMVDLYGGSFLEQFFVSDSDAFEEWAVLKREWLQREVTEAFSLLADYHERRGEYRQAQQYARRQVQMEPWREEAHRQLMRLLALDGQRSAALTQYETCRRALAAELGVEPTAETVALYGQILAEEISTLLPCSPAPLLPCSPTPFVGRETELAEIAELLVDPDCRLVTLVGPGGIGKSRLALQAAADHVGAFADGVYFAPLISINSPESIGTAIAEAIGFSFRDSPNPREQLVNHLREKEMLLVLDNLEHVLEGGNLLAEILRHAPGVRLLVTSRERLSLQEEWVYAVAGLTCPQNEPGDDWAAYSAPCLFQQRARQADRGFSLAMSETPAVVRICQLAEGMPLAIELAAAWVAAHPCAEIARQIECNLDVLTTTLRNVPERQRSMRATFEYSWQLLSDVDRDAFARLSVFRDGFRPEAAKQITGISPRALSALADKSLVRRVSPERYDMHEMLRQYAAEKLASNPQEQERVQLRHARYFAAFLERQTNRLQGAEQKHALLEIASEIENSRQAWRVAVTHNRVHEIEQSLESLYHFYDIRSRFQEGIELLAQAIDRWGSDEQQAHVAGRLMARQGALYHHLGFYQQARNALEQSLLIAERLNIQAEQIFCLVNLAKVARSQGKHEETEQLAHKSLALAKQVEDNWGTATSLFLLGAVRYRAGDIDQAEALLKESLAFGHASGNPRLILPPLNVLADIACYRGDLTQAQPMFEECVALSRELGDLFNIALHLNNLGTVAHGLEQYAAARVLYQESLDICIKIGDRAGQVIALSNLGEVAFAFGAYTEAQQYYEEGLAIGRTIQDQWTIVTCLNNLGEIACTLGDYRAAKTYLAECIQIADASQILTALMKALVNLAVLFSRQGQMDQAAKLLALARVHPASEQDLQKKAERLAAELGLVLPTESVPRPLNEVAAEVLAELAR